MDYFFYIAGSIISSGKAALIQLSNHPSTSTPTAQEEEKGYRMASLNLDRAKTAILSMDMQKAPVRRSAMFRERNVGQAAKSVLEAARKAGSSCPRRH